jgi:hypothetical protein
MYRFYNELLNLHAFASNKEIFYVSVTILFLWIIRKKIIKLPIRKSYLLAIFFLMACIPWIFFYKRPIDPVLDILTINVIRVNQQIVFNRSFDVDILSKTHKAFPRIAEGFATLSSGVNLNSCAGGDKPNMVILISESLSQVDSIRSGGLFDRLPRIDKMLAQGLTLTNVISNGNNTSDALAALLLGTEPFPTRVLSGDMPARFPAQVMDERNIIRYAKKQGYKTLALTNSPLRFQKNGEWFIDVGFDYVEGGESNVFRDQPHFAFNSPPDEALYSHALSIIPKQNEPFLLLLLTISLHKPYVSPTDEDSIKGNSLLGVLNYVDRTTYSFYLKLQEQGFFNNGILLLIGDHRRMDVLEPIETSIKGSDSFGRIVGGFIGSGFSKSIIDDTPLNQTDINTIVRHLLDGCDVNTHSLSIYNKCNFLGISEPFTTHLIEQDMGLLLMRIKNSQPRILKLHGKLNPLDISTESIYRDIAAYIVLNSAWLQEKQNENKNLQ